MSGNKVTSAPSATSGIAVGVEGVDLSALDELNKPSGKHVNDAVTQGSTSKMLTDSAFATLWSGNPETGTAGINPASQTDTGNLIAELMNRELPEPAQGDPYHLLGQTDPDTGEVITLDSIAANSQSPINIYNNLPESNLTEAAFETMDAAYASATNLDVVENVPLEQYYDGTENTA